MAECEVVDLTVDNIECAICLQQCIHPAQLPCGHIFCFLCIKGIANQSKKCAMCRQEIPGDFLNQPKLLETPGENKHTTDGYQWFYEGRNGWWKYDERTNNEIEENYCKSLNSTEILICGEIYIIDFKTGIQYPKSRPNSKRHIKRNFNNTNEIKGIAGLYC